MIKLPYIFILSFLILPSCNVSQKERAIAENPEASKDTLIINVGDLFETRNERLSIYFYNVNGERITSIPYDSSIIVVPKINYDLKYKLVSLSDSIFVSEIAQDTFVITSNIQYSERNKKTPTVDFAFVVDDSKQDFFYRYRRISADSSIVEWTREIDTCYIITYQIK